MTDNGLHLTVIRDGQRIVLPPRIIALCKALIRQADQISDPPKVQIVFDCAGKSAQMAVTERVKVQ